MATCIPVEPSVDPSTAEHGHDASSAPGAGPSRPPSSRSATELVLWILQNGAKSLGVLIGTIVRLAAKGVGALAEYLYSNRHLLLTLPVRILIVLKHVVAGLINNPVTRAVGRLLSNLVYLKVSLEKAVGKGPNGRSGVHTTICTCFSLLFGLLELESQYKLYLGLPLPSKPPVTPKGAPIPDPLAPPTPLRDFTPTAAANRNDTEEVHLLCSSELKDHIMRFLYTQSQTTGGRFLLLNSSSFGAEGAGGSSSAAATRLQQHPSAMASHTALFLQERHWASNGGRAQEEGQAAGSQLASPAAAGAAPPVAAPWSASAPLQCDGATLSADEQAALAAPAAVVTRRAGRQQAAAGAASEDSPEQLSPVAQHPLRRRNSRTSLEEESAAGAGARAVAAAAPSAADKAAAPAAAALEAQQISASIVAAAQPGSTSSGSFSTPPGASKTGGRPPLPYASTVRRVLQHSGSDQGCSLVSSTCSAAMPAILGLKSLLSGVPEAELAASAAGAGSGVGSMAPVPWLSPQRSPSRAPEEMTAAGCEGLSRNASSDSV